MEVPPIDLLVQNGDIQEPHIALCHATCGPSEQGSAMWHLLQIQESRQGHCLVKLMVGRWFPPCNSHCQRNGQATSLPKVQG